MNSEVQRILDYLSLEDRKIMENALQATPKAAAPGKPYAYSERVQFYNTLIKLRGKDRLRYLLTLNRPWQEDRSLLLGAIPTEDMPVALNHLLALSGEPTISLPPVVRPSRGILGWIEFLLFGDT